jgi:hypothetical protein
MAEQTENDVKITVEKIIVKVTYEWDTAEPKTKVVLTLLPSTKIADLLRRLGINVKKSDLSFVHGGVELDGTKTFAECDIPEGTILTVGVKRKRGDDATPEPENVLKVARMKAPVKEKTPEPEDMQNTPKWTSKPVMRPVTGAAALHVLLMRVGCARDAYEVYDFRPDSVYTNADVEARIAEFAEVLGAEVSHSGPTAVRTALFSVVKRAFRRVTWAMDIIFARFGVMDGESAGETDMEA